MLDTTRGRLRMIWHLPVAAKVFDLVEIAASRRSHSAGLCSPCISDCVVEGVLWHHADHNLNRRIFAGLCLSVLDGFR